MDTALTGTTPAAQITAPTGVINLQTLNATLQNSTQALYLIATNLKNFISAFNIAFPSPLTSSATWNPPSLVSGASESTTVVVSGAALGNYVQVAFSLDLQGLSLVAYVSSANTATVTLSNLTGGTIDLASGILKVRVTTV